MRGNGVGFKASKVHFSSTSVVVVFVFTEEAPEERETHGGSSRSKHLYRARGLYQPCLYTKKADKDDWLGKDDLVLFVEFCSTAQIGFVRRVLFDGPNRFIGKFSSLVNFRRFYPYPYWIEEFLIKGLIRAGLALAGLALAGLE